MYEPRACSTSPTTARGRGGSSVVMLALVVVLAPLGACGGPAQGSPDDAEPVASAPADPDVGYDLRRLRPTDEPLAARFDRLRAESVAEGKRVAVLFSADWCEPCRLLELELGNMHPASAIGDVRIFTLKEEDWEGATRMDEVNGLRNRWHPTINSYPVLVLLDAEGNKLEEMKEAKARLEEAGVAATIPNWFQGTRGTQA